MAHLILYKNSSPMSTEEFLDVIPVGNGWKQLVGELIELLWTLGWDGRVGRCVSRNGELQFVLPPQSLISDHMWDKIRQAEIKSTYICEQCGNPVAQVEIIDKVETLCANCVKRQ